MNKYDIDRAKTAAFNNRKISIGKAILEGIVFAVGFVGFVVLCAVA